MRFSTLPCHKRSTLYRLTFILLSLISNAAHSAPKSITIIADHLSQHQYRGIISSIQQHAPTLESTPSTQILDSDEKQQITKALADEKTCIVSLGPKSFEAINKHPTHCSISLLISRNHFQNANTNFLAKASAIYKNQPLERVGKVVQSTLKHVKKASIIISDDWPHDIHTKHNQIDLDIQHFKASDSIIEAFRLASKDSDIIIALPDPNIYNKSNIKNILLTSYKAKTPLIGYSEALSRAGALISVFTPAEYLGKQVVEWFSQGQKKIAAEPKYFKVKLNKTVALSLGSALKNESLLLQDIWTDSNE